MSTASNMTNNEVSQACLATRQSLITPTNFRFDYFPYGEGSPLSIQISFVIYSLIVFVPINLLVGSKRYTE